jgi:3-hexulose-6-phosphate synthase/6-phospho-3-hexuloisomerase
MWPKVQLALDLLDLDEALGIAEKCVDVGIDWIEAGTPLLNSCGMEAIRALKERFPDHDVVADLKVLDTGFHCVEMCARAGADIVGIAGVATNYTVMSAVEAAKDYDVDIVADLIALKDPMKRAKELIPLGVDYLEFHLSIDEREYARRSFPFDTVKKLSKLSLPLAVAGGLDDETAPRVVENGAKVVIVGGYITKSESPRERAQSVVEAIKLGR